MSISPCPTKRNEYICENLTYPYFRHQYKPRNNEERKPSRDNPFNNLLPTDYTSKNIDKISKSYTKLSPNGVIFSVMLDKVSLKIAFRTP